MYKDRDYIVGIMNALDDMDEQIYDAHEPPSPEDFPNQFHPEIDAAFTELDKRVGKEVLMLFDRL